MKKPTSPNTASTSPIDSPPSKGGVGGGASRSRHVSDDELNQAIMGGITFKGAKLKAKPTEEKVKTKAKKKSYITGTHGSASAKHKADIRQRRANRHKK